LFKRIDVFGVIGIIGEGGKVYLKKQGFKKDVFGSISQNKLYYKGLKIWSVLLNNYKNIYEKM
jgi:hypothetical protein